MNISLIKPLGSKVLFFFYPDVWKKQLTYPTFKKGPGTRPDDWRPIRHIQEIGKLCESLIADQLMNHFTAGNIWHQSLHGGITGLSTFTACAEIEDRRLTSYDRGQINATLLVDQKSAYDVISHNILLAKLVRYHFDSSTVNWFKTYLSHRCNQVVIQGVVSEELPVGDKGAPQGSVLGGILYNIYANDLPTDREGESTEFVDDHADQDEGSTVDEAVSKLQLDADKTSDWLEINGMMISGEKSKLLISRTKTPPLKSITLDNTQIEATRSERYLGIYLAADLTYQPYLYGETWREKENFPGLISILNRRIEMLRKIRRYTAREKMLIMTDGIVFSKMRYNIGIVGNIWLENPYIDKETQFQKYTKKDNQRLQIIQNKALKMALGVKENNIPTKKLLEDAGKLSVHQEIVYQIGVNAKKILDTNKPKSLSQQFLKKNNDRGSRKNTYLKKKTKTKMAEENFINHAINLMNKIPPEILAEEKMKRFKKEIKNWIKKEIKIKP